MPNPLDDSVLISGFEKTEIRIADYDPAAPQFNNPNRVGI